MAGASHRERPTWFDEATPVVSVSDLRASRWGGRHWYYVREVGVRVDAMAVGNATHDALEREFGSNK